jgi:trimethylamine--corrinoid protein Co-methyltransferase
MFTSVGAGHDLIVNCGMFATGLTCSNEQLLMDEEISAMCRRIAAGVSVNKDTIAVDLIKQIGPHGGTYLITDHTMKWLYSDEYIKPRLSVRGAYALWEQNGAKDTYQLAREKIDGYAEFEPPQLPPDMAAKLDEIISSF